MPDLCGRECLSPAPASSARVVYRGLDAQPPHLGNQSCSRDSQAGRGSMPPSDHPLRFLQRLKNMVAGGVLESLAALGLAALLGPQLTERRLKYGASRNNHAVLNEILELADIAWPIVGHHGFHG